jgi:enterochelin esterase-like enzyme
LKNNYRTIILTKLFFFILSTSLVNAKQHSDLDKFQKLQSGLLKPPPIGFDIKKPNILRGEIDTLTYFSNIEVKNRKLVVYTPPQYNKSKKYPVLFLLHGIGGNESDWQRIANINIIFDNLYASKKIEPMLIVMPYGKVRIPSANHYHSDFKNFDKELLNEIIPFIEKNYEVISSPEYRAIAGLSMGGSQALNIGLKHLNKFAWIGGFSTSGNVNKPEELIPNKYIYESKVQLLWISCGNKDHLLPVSQKLHRYLENKGLKHVWHVDNGGHQWKVWKNDIYHFSQSLFK